MRQGDKHRTTENGVEGSDPLSPEGSAALCDLARRYRWRLVVLFGSLARAEQGRDVDLAVLPAVAGPELMEQGGWQACLEALFAPRPVDLVLLHDAVPPLTRFEVFRHGRCLFESRPGLFASEQDRAFFLYADSEKFRRAGQEVLRGRAPA
jgi:predicted nucleotidyltransferase